MDESAVVTADADQQESLLAVEAIEAGYGAMQVLWGVDLSVAPQQRVVLLGANGAGKSTLLRAVLGLLPITAGSVRLRGELISTTRTDRRIAQGIGYMTETGVFPELSVRENLLLGAFRLDGKTAKANLERAYDLFPVVSAHRKRPAGSLSGGQRKLVGVAKVLMGDPQLIVMDEPSSGLSPIAVQEVIDGLCNVDQSGVSMLIAEQDIAFLDLAEQVVVLEGGRTQFSGSVTQLQADDSCAGPSSGWRARPADRVPVGIVTGQSRKRNMGLSGGTRSMTSGLAFIRSSSGCRSSAEPSSRPTSAGPYSRLLRLTYSKSAMSSSGPSTSSRNLRNAPGSWGNSTRK